MKTILITTILVARVLLLSALAGEPDPDLRPLNWLMQYKGLGGETDLVQAWREAALKPESSNGSEAWCGAAVNAAVTRFGHRPPAHPAVARNWLEFGVPTSNPQPGDIVVFWRESKASWKGHVAILISRTEDGVTVLGGNQGNKVSVAWYPPSKILGFRRIPKNQ